MILGVPSWKKGCMYLYDVVSPRWSGRPFYPYTRSPDCRGTTVYYKGHSNSDTFESFKILLL